MRGAAKKAAGNISAVVPETKERAQRIGASYVHELPITTCPHCDSMLFVRFGKCENCGKRVSPPPMERRVFDQWPLKRLHVRGHLSDTQFAAGDHYYKHWYGAGLSPYGSVDLGAVGRNSSGPSYGMATSERQAYHREKYREAVDAMGKDLRGYVDGIVLQEDEPESVGKSMTGRGHSQQARAVAIEMLKIGLDRIAAKYALE